MPFPAEFQFVNEDDFIRNMIIPLLQRVGFVMVANYHGAREFGKDIVFAEVDRLGHVRYHGLQAKYVPSISVNEADGLIIDCRQAFDNPFRHPQTGADERISTFYAVNGGTLSEQAATNFFNALTPRYGGNVRLLDGSALLVLDRNAVAGTLRNDQGRLNGLLLEFAHNRYEAELINKMVDGRHEPGKCVVPLRRLRLAAMTDFLIAPVASEKLSARQLEGIWHNFWLANQILDSIMTTGAKEYREEMAKKAVIHINQVMPIMDEYECAVRDVLRTLGPLATI